MHERSENETTATKHKNEDFFKELDKDAEVNLQNANGDIETQKQQIKYLIDKKVDVLIIVCIDSDSLSDVVAEAKSAGIPVIAYDRLIKNADVDVYLSFDNEMVGQLMGEALVEAGLPNKKVMMLSSFTTVSNTSSIKFIVSVSISAPFLKSKTFLNSRTISIPNLRCVSSRLLLLSSSSLIL